MKTLQEYILEAIDKDTFLDFVQKSFNIKNGDYEEPYNIIKNKNYKQMLNDFCENKNISPEIIVKLEDFTNLSEFINTLVNLNEGEKLLNINDLEKNVNILYSLYIINKYVKTYSLTIILYGISFYFHTTRQQFIIFKIRRHSIKYMIIFISFS